MSDVDAVREELCQLWGALGPSWGISPTTARIYSWLLSREDPQDAESIMEGLELSRGAVSMSCRELREWGLIFPEKARGARRTAYRPATDLEKVIRNIVRHRKRREWDPIRERLQEWIPRLEEDDSAEARVFRERLRSLESVVGLADQLMEGFLRGGFVGKLGLRLLVEASRRDEPELIGMEKTR